ncbi:MAG: hypothetical protein HDS27_01630 [Bacteroides sp.]|nr:hypothetical protein [Bacteroides sp.]
MGKKSTMLAGLLAFAGVAAYAAPATAPVTEQPQGTECWFSEECIAYSVSSWGFIDYNMQDGFAKKVVFSEDGKTVWFRNPITKRPTGTWVEGTIEGDIITLPMGQVISITESKDGTEDLWTIDALKEEVDEEGKKQWVVTGVDNITFTYKDGTIKQNEEGVMLGLFCNGEYMIYGDVDIKMCQVNPTADVVTFPEDAEIQNWTFSYGKSLIDGYSVEVAVVENDVYVRGFWEANPNATIKGVLENGVLTFPAGQYLGYITSSGLDYFMYFMTCSASTASIMQYYQPLDEALAYTLDSETGKFTQVENASGEPLKLMVKGGKYTDFELTKSVAFLVLDNPEFKMASDVYGTPQAPSLDPSYCFRRFAGFTQLEFNIFPFDEEGNVLSKSDLAYTIWVDGEKVLFESGDFANWEKIPEPTYEMPLDFMNGWGVMYDDDNLCHRRVQVPFADPEKLGAQVIYTDPVTGEQKKSLIAYYYPDTKEVKYEDELGGSSVDAIEAEAVEVAYFDMLGQRVADNYRGVCVKVTSYADGSVKSVKTVR